MTVKELPKRVIPKLDTPDPSRENLRIETILPILTKSKVEKVDAKHAHPYALQELPCRMRERQLKVEPILIISSAERQDPNCNMP
jgi:hypothetical protein